MAIMTSEQLIAEFNEMDINLLNTIQDTQAILCHWQIHHEVRVLVHEHDRQAYDSECQRAHGQVVWDRPLAMCEECCREEISCVLVFESSESGETVEQYVCSSCYAAYNQYPTQA